MFQYTPTTNNRWFEPYVRWRETAAERGIEIATWDMHPVESADVVWYMDLPQHRSDLLDVKRKAARAKFVLMILESPLGRPHAFVRANHDLFDAVTTYNWRLCDERRYFRYFLPIGAAPLPADPPFDERKPLVMINSNRLLGPFGLLAFRQPGLGGLPGVGWLFNDWKVGAGLFTQTRGELYSRRRRIARLADREFPGLLEIYGPGWRGEPVGWINKLARPRPFACGTGRRVVQKDELLPHYRFGVAFENMVGDVGYVSEKIFDTLLAGVVPLYLGDARVAEHIDPDCFIDARKFRSDREMLTFVRDCPVSEWRRLREAGRRYLNSDAAKKFFPEAFAERMNAVLAAVTAP